MRHIADLHIHSKYSRATSKDMDIDHIAATAKQKGINIIGTGDFTHPFWLGQIKEKLNEDGSGLLTHDKYPGIKFLITAEISSIYTQDGRGRRVHSLILVPDIKTATEINDRLTGFGNLYSDGRPILGISAKDLARLILEINPKAVIIPAHAWTPWFSIFGSNSGFDSIEGCYGDLAPYIYSIETGLSSDPEMNWRLSALDKITLISNSDAHSPGNLGREANVFELSENPTFEELSSTIKSKDPKKFLYTIEFYPEEGKYHFDGHRNCEVSVNPFETKYPNNLCPKCGKKLTIGVMNRVDALSDRPTGYKNESFPGSKHLVQLRQIIADALEVNTSSQKVEKEYQNLLQNRTEFDLLLDASVDMLYAELPRKIAEGIVNARTGKISIEPGFDGVYGKVKVFGDNQANLQSSLF